MRFRKNKYGNKKNVLHGKTFDSKRESLRYAELLLLEKSNKITDIHLQKSYQLTSHGKNICKYIADFVYYDVEKKCIIIEDVKGFETAIFKIKRKLFEAQYKEKINIIK